MDGASNATDKGAVAFFALYYLCGTVVVLNVIVAFTIDTFTM